MTKVDRSRHAIFLGVTPRLEDVLTEVDASHLRGLGGACFPASRKWRFVRAESGPRVVALNADEGEPGTFKDRHVLESDPHRVLEHVRELLP